MSISTTTLIEQAKKLPASKIKNCKVRECDEVSKGCFVSYVDDKEDSYDVKVCFNNHLEEIESSECDCANGNTICHHKLLLIQHVVENNTTSYTKLKRTKKISPLMQLIQDISNPQLIDWLHEVLTKNKELELSFVNRFGNKTETYTHDKVSEITKNAIKAILQRKKAADATQLKQILILWADLHKPIIEQYENGPADEQQLKNIDALTNSCLSLSLTFNSTKIYTYLDKQLKKCASAIHNLQIETSWQKCVSFFATLIYTNHRPNAPYFNLLNNLAAASSAERKRYIADCVMNNYNNQNHSGMAYAADYTKNVFNIIEVCERLSVEIANFKPVRWENKFNLVLIDALIKGNLLDKAETFCLSEISSNYNESFSIPYYELLKIIYKQNDNTNKYIDTIKFLLPYTFDIIDFKQIINYITNPDEAKKFRTSILSKAKHASSFSVKAKIFRFELFKYENKIAKIYEEIDGNIPFKLLYNFIDPLFEFDKEKFLNQLLDKYPNDNLNYKQEYINEQEEYLIASCKRLIELYGRDFILQKTKSYISRSRYYRSDILTQFENLLHNK